jgi:hypothetical protein
MRDRHRNGLVLRPGRYRVLLVCLGLAGAGLAAAPIPDAGASADQTPPSASLSWAAVPSPALPAVARLSNVAGVACTSSAFCVAVGQTGPLSISRTLTETWDGTRWKIRPSPNLDASVLNGVSCERRRLRRCRQRRPARPGTGGDLGRRNLVADPQPERR